MFTKTERQLIEFLDTIENPTCASLADAMYGDRPDHMKPKKPLVNIRVLICLLRKKLSRNNIILERGNAAQKIYRIDRPERLRELVS